MTKLEKAIQKLKDLGFEILKEHKKEYVWYIDYCYDNLKYSKAVSSILKYDMC